MIRISVWPPRCYLFRHRIHHGLLGLVLLVHDRRDYRCWLRDLWTRR